MNKELIKKYKKEFDYWMDGGNVQAFYKEDDETKWWSDKESMDYDGDDNFSHIIANSLGLDDVLIVIDDEYIEFRKALAEGKVVQYNFGNHGISRKDYPNIWKDLDLSIGILADRACPENYRIKPEEPKFKVGDWITNGVEVWQHKENCRVKNQTNWNLWQPKVGESCLFSNKDEKPVIGTFLEMFNGDLYVMAADKINTFEFCEPFIGELPTNLKEPK